MKNYRTEEQFIELMETALNGNWSDAFKLAEEGGFFAQDLINHYHSVSDVYNFDIEDLIYIAEGAQSLR